MTLKTFLSRFLFISVLGVLLHFTYEWSGDNPIVALFSAVNIALYFLGIFLALCIENKINRGNSQNHSAFAAIVLLALTIAFFVFTKYPPSIGLFANPVLTGFHRSEGADCILRYALHGKALLF